MSLTKKVLRPVCNGLLVLLVTVAAAAAEPTSSRSNEAFSLKLLQAASTPFDNVCVSPLSVELAFSQLFPGARGTSSDQIRALFALPASGRRASVDELLKKADASARTGGAQLHIADAFFIDAAFTLLDSFRKSLADLGLNASDFILDFKKASATSVHKINQWVSKETKGKINELLKAHDVTPATKLVVVDAMYFKGDWLEEFNPSDTSTESFHPTPKTEVKVPFMHQYMHLPFFESDEFSAIAVPFRSTDYALYFLLPKVRYTHDQLLSRLSVEKLHSVFEGSVEQSVVVSLPRFTLSQNIDLVEILKGLGLTTPFSDADADFSGVDGTRSLFISKVRHQATITISEKGAEASAATAILMPLGAAGSDTPPKEFTADRPFIFFLREKTTGEILLMGATANPLQ